MKVGDLVKWTIAEECYHIATRHPGIPCLAEKRKRGVVLAESGPNLTVRWENGDLHEISKQALELTSES